MGSRRGRAQALLLGTVQQLLVVLEDLLVCLDVLL